MSVLVVIPARGGSKGIPRKSIRPVAGKPMISYAIRAALAAQGVDRVAVSTDDDRYLRARPRCDRPMPSLSHDIVRSCNDQFRTDVSSSGVWASIDRHYPVMQRFVAQLP